MPIPVTCPNPDCGAVANVEEQSLGKRGRCKKCGHVFALARPGGETASGTSGDASAWKRGSQPSSPTNLPEQFGRYRIMSQLGQGGMGAVYLAFDTKLEREVALKVPYFSPADGPQAVQRFEREARAAATLDHPNLCPIHDVGEIDGIHFLTMPYIKGKTLAQAVGHDQTVTEAQAAAIGLKLAQALQEAHDKGIIHRDLKPGNIMINRRRELIVMDFGLARMAGGDSSLTGTGNVLGTALYMAPEQASGDLSLVGPAADVYSLGVILYELLTGRPPFDGPWGLVIGLKNVKDPDPPSKHRPDLSPRLDAICHKAIAREPKDRYATMNELANDLEAFLTKSRAPIPDLSASGTVVPQKSPESLAAQLFAGIVTQEVTSLRGEAPSRLPEPGPAPEAGPSLSLPPGQRRAWPTLLVSSLVGAAAMAWLAYTFLKPPSGTTASKDGSAKAKAGLQPDRTAKKVDTKPDRPTESASPEPDRPTNELSRPTEPRIAQDPGFRPLFNGKDLTGWIAPGQPDLFTVEDGAILGKTDGRIARDSYLVTDRSYGDFALKASVKFTSGNSGILFRGKRANDGTVAGPQADIGQNAWGIVYEEPGRGVLSGFSGRIEPQIREGGWNDFLVTVKGDYITISVNGLVVFERVDVSLARSGIIALEVRKGTPTEVRFKDLEIQELGPAGPEPVVAEAPPSTPEPAKTVAVPTSKKALRNANPGARPNIPNDAVAFGGNRYKLFPELKTWPEAKKICEDMGGHLVVSNNEAENSFLVSLLAANNAKEIWLGATDEVVEGKWVWVDGSRMDYSRWDPAYNQPNNGGGNLPENYAMMKISGLWWDLPDHAIQGYKPGYVCEWETSRVVEVEKTPKSVTPSRKAKAAASESRAPAEAVAFEGNRYLVIHEIVTWSEAVKRCEALGGHLVVIKSEEENQFVTSLLSAQGVQVAWLGATDEQIEGRWVWLDGTEMRYENWDVPNRQPTNRATTGALEHYLVTRTDRNGVWWDVPDGSEPALASPGFVCEWGDEKPKSWVRRKAISPIPGDVKMFAGKRWKAFPEKLSWHQARIKCEEMGGRLAIIANEEENRFVKTLLDAERIERAYLGATDEPVEGQWTWIDGLELSYANWMPGQPTNQGQCPVAEHYLMMGKNGGWNDVSNKNMVGYVCQWD